MSAAVLGPNGRIHRRVGRHTQRALVERILYELGGERGRGHGVSPAMTSTRFGCDADRTLWIN